MTPDSALGAVAVYSVALGELRHGTQRLSE
jgi:hypothetical protein